MRAEMIIALMSMAFVFGCNQTDNVKPTVSIHKENSDKVRTPKTDAISATLTRMAMAGVSLTNCLYRSPGKAMDVHRQILDDILTLPPREGEQCVKTIVKSVMSVPYERLDHYMRAKALRVMWDIMGDIGWPGIGEVDCWEMRILRLSKMRDMVKYAQTEPNNWTTRSFIAGHLSYLESDSGYLEQILAAWIESSHPPETRLALSRTGMTEEDCAVVKAKFESFLGRPIRTLDEIRQAHRERVKQWDLESERIAAEQRKLAAMILKDRRTGGRDAWHIGATANTNQPVTATNKPFKVNGQVQKLLENSGVSADD